VKNWKSVMIIGMATMMIAFGWAWAKGPGNGGQGMMMPLILDNLPTEELSTDEISGLQYMYQEEKLARDVYQELYAKWNLPVFSNIARSEQQHMNAVKALMDKYGIVISLSDDTPGTFGSDEFVKLYNELIAEGSQSLTQALAVGATIEDLDISDLQNRLAQTDNTDIKWVYQNLMKGSRNHLRAFVAQLSAQQGSYEPEYLSQVDYEAIINSPWERGMVDGNGNLVAMGGCGGKQGKRGGCQNKGGGKQAGCQQAQVNCPNSGQPCAKRSAQAISGDCPRAAAGCSGCQNRGGGRQAGCQQAQVNCPNSGQPCAKRSAQANNGNCPRAAAAWSSSQSATN